MYIGRPLSNGCALDNTTTDLRSHVPWLYKETPIETWNLLSKILTIMLLQCTENNTQGDYSLVLVGSQVIRPRVRFTVLGWSYEILGWVLLLDPTVYHDLWYLDTLVRFIYSYPIYLHTWLGVSVFSIFSWLQYYIYYITVGSSGSRCSRWIQGIPR